MGDLSLNFSRKEFRCRHCNNLIIKEDLICSLQELRNLVQRPIHILSGYRCKKHPESLKNPDSYHTKGMAADISIDGLTVKEMYNFALNIEKFRHGGIGLYDSGFIHVDIRQNIARWARINGNYVGISQFLN